MKANFSKILFLFFQLSSSLSLLADFAQRAFSAPPLVGKFPSDFFQYKNENDEQRSKLNFFSQFQSTFLAKDQQKKIFGNALPYAHYTELSQEALALADEMGGFVPGFVQEASNVIKIFERISTEEHIWSSWSIADLKVNFGGRLVQLCAKFGLAGVVTHPYLFGLKRDDFKNIQNFSAKLKILAESLNLESSPNGSSQLSLVSEQFLPKMRILLSPLEFTVALPQILDSQDYKLKTAIHFQPGTLAFDSIQDYDTIDWHQSGNFQDAVDQGKLFKLLMTEMITEKHEPAEPNIFKLARFAQNSNSTERTTMGLGFGQSLEFKACLSRTRDIELQSSAKVSFFPNVKQKTLFFSTHSGQYVLGTTNIKSKQAISEFYGGVSSPLLQGARAALGASVVLSKNFDFELEKKGVLSDSEFGWASGQIVENIHKNSFGYFCRLHLGVNAQKSIEMFDGNFSVALFSDPLALRFIKQRGVSCDLNLTF